MPKTPARAQRFEQMSFPDVADKPLSAQVESMRLFMGQLFLAVKDTVKEADDLVTFIRHKMPNIEKEMDKFSIANERIDALGARVKQLEEQFEQLEIQEVQE